MTDHDTPATEAGRALLEETFPGFLQRTPTHLEQRAILAASILAIEDQARSLAALGGTPGADRPSPYALWRQANGDRDAYIALMKQHGHLVPREPSADSVTDQVTVIAEAKYAVEMLDLLCEMGFGTDMATSVPVSVPLRDALARRYQEREKDGVGAGMTHSDWRHVIDAGLPPLGIEAPASSEEGR